MKIQFKHGLGLTTVCILNPLNTRELSRELPSWKQESDSLVAQQTPQTKNVVFPHTRSPSPDSYEENQLTENFSYDLPYSFKNS